MIKRGFLYACVLLFAAITLANSSVAAQKTITLWLCPHPYFSGTNFDGSSDFNSLFNTYFSQWPNIRSHVEVFKFYQHPFYSGSGLYTDAQVQQIIERLEQCNIDMAFESGAVTDWSPDGTEAARVTNVTISRIKSLGGKVKYVAMDEPLCLGIKLGQSPDDVVDHVDNYLDRVKAAHPDAIIGEIMAYPFVSMALTLAYLQSLKNRTGKWLPFVHLDVDLNHLNQLGLGLSEISDLKAFCTSHGIQFGIIFTHNELEASSDSDYYVGTLSWAASINSQVGMPDHIISQSWQDKPDYCLPENSNSSMLHVTSRLYSLYGPNDNSQIISYSIPSQMAGGGTYNISVVVRNTGNTTWTKGLNYRLVIDPNIDQVWGINEVLLGNNDAIAPGQSKTFQFPVTAPASSGSYPCNWLMRVGPRTEPPIYQLFGKLCSKNVSVSGVQLISNSGFEAGTGGDASNWTEGTSHARNSGQKHSGSYSLKATCAGVSTSSRTISFSVTPNTNYTFSAWVYNSLTSGNAYLDMNDIGGEASMSSTRGMNQWQGLSKVWNSGSNTSLIVRCVTDANPQGIVWFDDIKLTQ